jgi:hypothetical protein
MDAELYVTSDIKRVSIIQSCYIPWKGFFDLIGQCDEYIIFDSAQYVKRHWHNRNKIKTAKGAEWITIPVLTKSQYEQRIDEVEISESWADKHWRGIELNYRKAASFSDYGSKVKGWLEAVATMPRLTDVNEYLLRAVARELDLKVEMRRDTEYEGRGSRSERLLSLCQAAKATHYLSGPSAKVYLDEALFRDAGITVEWMEYGPYQPYQQLHGDFEHAVSIVDLLLNQGARAKEFAGKA